MCQQIIPFYWWVVLYYIDIVQFTHLPANGRLVWDYYECSYYEYFYIRHLVAAGAKWFHLGKYLSGITES